MIRQIILILFLLVSSLFATYQLAPGDTVDVVFKVEQKYSTKQKISFDGTITLPFVEIIKVSGMTHPDLQALLKKEYAGYITKDTPLVYVTPRPVYIIWHDLNKDKVETQLADTPAEASAIVSKYYEGDIVPGQVIHIQHGKPFSWWQNNWYKLLSALSMIVAIAK